MRKLFYSIVIVNFLRVAEGARAAKSGQGPEEESTMAEGLNRVMLLGNLGADPELKTTQGGDAVLRLRLATTERYLDRNKSWQERTEWHTVTLWGKRGEALHRLLTKGSTIFVEGSLRTSSYDDKEGVKRYKTEVTARNVILTGGRGGRSGDDVDLGAVSAPRGAPNRDRAPSYGGSGSSGGDDVEGGGDYVEDDIPF